MPAWFPFAVAAIVIVLIVGAVLSARARKRRRMALRAWAGSRNWSYTPEEVSTLERRFPAFSCLRRGDHRYGYNVMRGRAGDCEAWAFDYHYETHSTDSNGHSQTTHHRFSAVVVDSGLRLSPLSIRAEGLFDKLKGAFGFDDIDFESGRFSREFWVTSPDKRWAYDVLSQETIEFLLGAPRFALEFEGGPQAIAHRDRCFRPAEFAQALGVLTGVLDRIPADIRRDRAV
jgi:hypothetical protein